VDQSLADLLRPFLRFLPGDVALGPESRLRDLGLDSMHAIQLLFAVEDRYGIVIPDVKLTDATFETAGSLWEAIAETRAADIGAADIRAQEKTA
jgi:acyl carrier protein